MRAHSMISVLRIIVEYRKLGFTRYLSIVVSIPATVSTQNQALLAVALLTCDSALNLSINRDRLLALYSTVGLLQLLKLGDELLIRR